MTKKKMFFSSRQIFIPIAALILLALFNLAVDPSFFKITLGHNSAGDPVLTGYLMTILDYGSEVAILAIGMTLVTAACGGQDISVGAAVAIAGSVILRVLVGIGGDGTLQAPILVGFLAACVVSMLFGAFNGVLVAIFKIQPMVATLILYTAGRSIAAWINNNELPIVTDKTFTYFGGFIPGMYPYHASGAAVYDPGAVHPGGGNQLQLFPAQRPESGIHQVLKLCDSWPVRGCGGPDQDQPSVYHQLLGHRQGY